MMIPVTMDIFICVKKYSCGINTINLAELPKILLIGFLNNIKISSAKYKDMIEHIMMLNMIFINDCLSSFKCINIEYLFLSILLF